MDIASQHVVMALDAIGSVQSQLQSFGYRLYLDTKAHSWTQPTSIHLWYNGGRPPRAAGFAFGFCILGDSSGDIGFSFEVAWNTQNWSVQCSVEDETRNVTTEALWKSPKFQATTLPELLEALQSAVDGLISSARNPRIAACLATIERRP
jgi:hypothetical protein